jgi:enoyl-CoA hydratase
MSSTLLVSENAGVATATLSSPNRLNALSSHLLLELAGLVTALNTRPVESRPRVLIIAGSDRAFAAGADIKELSSLDRAGAERVSRVGHELGRALDAAHFPSIAMVDGAALGGGLELAMACDLIFASERASFGQPEVKLGLIPGFGGTFRLTARVGIGTARRLIYSGEPIDAAEALRLRLVDAVYPADQLTAESERLAHAIAKKAPLAIAAAKRSLRQNLYRDFAAAAEAEVQQFSELFATTDAREGLAAFLGKRSPSFSGQ